ncbi:hypothetical protein [Mycolicibacterium gilvum]|uniref:hypothetical protein n=1 Tax=Mycolicibacterium gilvum TaxID=1804 RepID=UPI0040459004
MWVLGGLAVLVVIVLTVAATLFVTGRQSEEAGPDPAKPSPTTAVDTSEIASADDRRPAGIILEDPTCTNWSSIAAAFANSASNGWDRRDPTVPSERWSIDQKDQYQAVQATMREASNRSVRLARETPHRVMYELYSQFIAFGRAYADAIDHYTARDDALARVAISASSTISAICDAVAYGSAGARSALIAQAAPTQGLGHLTDPDKAQRLSLAGDSFCADWSAAIAEFDDAISSWKALDPNISATEMDPGHRAVLDATASTMTDFALQLQMLGIQSKDSVLVDFATLSAQYLRGYVSALRTYTPADNFLVLAASSSAAIVAEACNATGA